VQREHFRLSSALGQKAEQFRLGLGQIAQEGWWWWRCSPQPQPISFCVDDNAGCFRTG
jgi:hypothetical protein